MKNIKKFLLVLLLSSWSLSVFADVFTVKQIRINGLQRIPAETVENYLPIHEGERLNSKSTNSILNALYKTGFFSNISLSREGNSLIIDVVERPTIGKIKITGNSFIPTPKLMEVMKSVNVAAGQIYNEVSLERIKNSLLNQYNLLGRYNARVNVTVSNLSRNRVLIDIVISEGLTAKVKKITIIGNKSFSDKELDKQLELTTPGLLTYFTKADRFSQEKLDQSLQKLQNFYYDRGYLKFKVNSSQVSITPDRKSIYLTISIVEGPIFNVSGLDISGSKLMDKEALLKDSPVQINKPFSRKTVLALEKNISQQLGDKGYIFAVVTVNPEVNDAKREVFLKFAVNPGKRIYVRHVYFLNNTKTNDEVLRREVIQYEAAPISTQKIERSKNKLSLLPFLKEVKLDIQPVPHEDDLVDVRYSVKEDDAAQAKLSVGYSQVYHLQLGVGLDQKNFLGTGKTLGINLTRSHFQQYYGINYTDPYYTPDGISRSYSFYLSKVDPANANTTKGYTYNQYNLSALYDFPIGNDSDAFNRLALGYGIDDTLIIPGHSGISNQVANFMDEHGRHFQQFNLVAGLSRNSQDKAIFPTKGTFQSLNLNLYGPLTSRALKYYLFNYSGRWYLPLNKPASFVAVARANLGYGNSFSGGPENFPFFRNFYAGGIGNVAGYLGNTLGPKDSVLNRNGYGNPTGGNVLVTGRLGLVFPNYISENVRTTLFVDAGNVYNTFDNRKYGGTASGPLRYSVGLEADCLTLIGLVDLSIAKALNTRPGDSTEFFQFSLGANFG